MAARRLPSTVLPSRRGRSQTGPSCGVISCSLFSVGADGDIGPSVLKGFRLRAGRGMGDFALRGDLLCPRRQSRQNAAGGMRLEKHFVFLGRIHPGPPDFYGGAIKKVGSGLSAREKDRMPVCAPPAAAPCLLKGLLLLQESSRLPFCPRGAGASDGGGGKLPPYAGACPSLFSVLTAQKLSGHRSPGGTSNRGAAIMGPQWKPSEAGSIGRGRATE